VPTEGLNRARTAPAAGGSAGLACGYACPACSRRDNMSLCGVNQTFFLLTGCAVNRGVAWRVATMNGEIIAVRYAGAFGNSRLWLPVKEEPASAVLSIAERLCAGRLLLRISLVCLRRGVLRGGGCGEKTWYNAFQAGPTAWHCSISSVVAFGVSAINNSIARVKSQNHRAYIGRGIACSSSSIGR